MFRNNTSYIIIQFIYMLINQLIHNNINDNKLLLRVFTFS